MSQAHGDPLGLPLPGLVEFLGDVFSTKCSLAASLAFLLFDHILTWPMELRYIWKAKWTFAKLLYIVTHYWGISILIIYTAVFFNSNMSITFCRNFIYAEVPFAVITILLVEVILIARLYAVYDCNRVVLVFTSFLAVGAAISTMTISVVGIPRGFSLSEFKITGCYVISFPTFFGFAPVPQIICEGFLCILMVIRVYSVYKYCGAGPLLRLLIRDSVVYFFGIFGTLLVHILIWSIARPTLGDIALGWLTALPCVLGGRLLLNTRQRAAYEETLFSQAPTTMMHFGTASAKDQAQYTLNRGDITISKYVTNETYEMERQD